MSELLDAAIQLSADRTASALATYRDVINRAKSPKKGDDAKLSDAMQTLGLTAADVESDLEAIRIVAECQSKLIPPARLEQVREDVKRKHGETLKEYRELIHSMLDRYLDQASINEVSAMFYNFWRAAVANEPDRTNLRLKEEQLLSKLIHAFDAIERCEHANHSLNQQIARARLSARVFPMG